MWRIGHVAGHSAISGQPYCKVFLMANGIPEFTPSLTTSGKKRRHHLNAKVVIESTYDDLEANLFMAIATILESLKPRQKLLVVEFHINSGRQGPGRPGLTMLKIPGKEFMALALDGSAEMAKAMALTITQLDNPTARLRAEARARASGPLDDPAVRAANRARSSPHLNQDAWAGPPPMKGGRVSGWDQGAYSGASIAGMTVNIGQAANVASDSFQAFIAALRNKKTGP